MGQKVKPTVLRLGINKNWASRWFYKKNLSYFLAEDHLIRTLIKEKILNAGIDKIEIERLNEQIKVNIIALKPGLIIGRGGKGIEELRSYLEKKINKYRTENKKPLNYILNLNVEELKRGDVSAQVVAQQIAFEIEKRIPYRSVMKKYLENVMQNRNVKGVKIKFSGRLNGAEIARRDWLSKGRMPLQTLRANIDYGEATAFNTYGTVGIKVWIYKGDIFEKELI